MKTFRIAFNMQDGSWVASDKEYHSKEWAESDILTKLRNEEFFLMDIPTGSAIIRSAGVLTCEIKEI